MLTRFSHEVGMWPSDVAYGLNYGLERVLHERQSVEILGPLPPCGTLAHRARIAAIHDTGRHGIVVVEVESRDESGALAVRSEVASLVRSAGGFGPARANENAHENENENALRPPDAVVEQATRPNQALLYRWLGDDNPIHVEPRAARAIGLRRPILHGKCTFGFALRHVLDGLGGGDPRSLRAIAARFADVVFPGETLVTESWREDGGLVRFRTSVKERGKVVLSEGRARFGPLDGAAQAPARPAPASRPG
jgi:3-hydroxyacyl-CoA dehydrogenase/3a,7a,12a-trihydroxy-5b-cholest-24-enoyl-CoA hydratase